MGLGGVYELPGGQRRIVPMEGMRGLAVGLVFLVHFHALAAERFTASQGVSNLVEIGWRIGQIGVDLFFVLSGYLIYGAVVRDGFAFRPYLRRRVQRIYPVFLVMLGAYLALSLVMPSQSKLPHGAAAALTFIVANILLLPGLFPMEGIITAAWSLSYEFFYYLALPAVAALTTMRRRSPSWRLAFFVSLSVLMMVVAVAVPFEIPVRMVMFLSGIAVFELLQHFHHRVPASRTAQGIALAALIAMLPVIAWLQGPESAIGTPRKAQVLTQAVVLFIMFGMMVALAFRGNGVLTQLFSWTPLRWLGNMSYSYYLVHGLALQALTLVLDRALPGNLPALAIIPLALLAFGVTWVSATLLFVLVERPFSLLPGTRAARQAAPTEPRGHAERAV